MVCYELEHLRQRNEQKNKLLKLRIMFDLDDVFYYIKSFFRFLSVVYLFLRIKRLFKVFKVYFDGFVSFYKARNK